jgi:Gas vesicle protein
MTSENMVWPGASAAQNYGPRMAGGHEPTNLGDILERVLDKGLVIAGDIRVNLLDIELLTIKLRLVIASVETARELGIDWWENDPWLSSNSSNHRKLVEENRQLRDRLAAVESGGGATRAVDAPRERAGHRSARAPHTGGRDDSDEPGAWNDGRL